MNSQGSTRVFVSILGPGVVAGMNVDTLKVGDRLTFDGHTNPSELVAIVDAGSCFVWRRDKRHFGRIYQAIDRASMGRAKARR